VLLMGHQKLVTQLPQLHTDQAAVVLDLLIL
jgi:hypothetical protein